MSDFFDSFVSTGTSIVNGVVDNIEIVKDPAFKNYNAAQRVFGTAGEMGFSFYNLPKFKNSFIIEFVLTPFAKTLLKLNYQTHILVLTLIMYHVLLKMLHYQAFHLILKQSINIIKND